jgi:hypothetical protein
MKIEYAKRSDLIDQKARRKHLDFLHFHGQRGFWTVDIGNV